MAGIQVRADRNGKRWCSKCGKWKRLIHFWTYMKYAKVEYRRRCKLCMREYGTAWHRKNRKGKGRGWRKT